MWAPRNPVTPVNKTCFGAYSIFLISVSLSLYILSNSLFLSYRLIVALLILSLNVLIVGCSNKSCERTFIFSLNRADWIEIIERESPPKSNILSSIPKLFCFKTVCQILRIFLSNSFICSTISRVSLLFET